MTALGLSVVKVSDLSGVTEERERTKNWVQRRKKAVAFPVYRFSSFSGGKATGAEQSRKRANSYRLTSYRLG